MEQGLETELREFVLSNSTFGPAEIQQISTLLKDDYSQLALFKELVAELEQDDARSPATSVRLGVCQFLLGRFKSAQQTLGSSDGGAVAQFYLAKSSYALGRYDDAVKGFESAKTGGYDDGACLLGVAESKRAAGDAQGAMDVLNQIFGPVEQTAEYLYQRGATVSSLSNNSPEAVALFERAVEMDGDHAGALFGLGLENDRHGNDDLAFDLYRRAANCFPSNIGSLINLGVLYEDHGQFENASRCFERVLEDYPDHDRATLYLRDVRAAGDHVDPREDHERDRLAQILSRPISDNELSVRARNCLEKMGINALGDLTRVTENELLTMPNFGETSLYEIREILSAVGLRIGQFAHEPREQDEAFDSSQFSPEEQQLMERPMSELNLSVRARKCMTRLGLTTIGELLRRSGDDLLECKNFGVTSLNEIREKLGQAGLKLRGD